MNRQQKIKKLVDEIIGHKYGETISHFDIADLIKEKHGSQQYRSIVNAAQKKCVELGKMVESVRGYGYRVVNPDDYTVQSVRHVTAGARRIDKGTKILRCAPVNDMTQEGRETYNRVTDRMQILQAAMTGAKVEIRMLSAERVHPLSLSMTLSNRQ